MANDQSHIANDLLRRFISGDLGPREEAQLERLARKDAGLAEALSGIRQHPEASHLANLQSIRNKLPKSKSERRPAATRKLYQRLSAAAAVLVLISATVFFWPSTSQDTAMATEAAPLADGAAPGIVNEPDNRNEYEAVKVPEATAEEARPLSNDTGPAVSLPPPAPKATEPPPSNGYSSTTDDGAPQATGIPVAEADVVEEEVESEAATFADEMTESGIAPPEPAREPVATAAAKKADRLQQLSAERAAGNAPIVIQGFVTDEQDRPIPNANILLPGQPIGEQTDSNGYFQLVSGVKISNFAVEHPNYSPAEIKLPRGENEVVISLENLVEESAEDANSWTLNAARTTLYPNEQKSAAAPKDGMKALRQAMAKAKPDDLPGGRVKVSFSVQADGSLTDFEFGNRSEAALIPFVRNYLTQRSEWTLSGGDMPARMSLTFRFE